MGSPAVILASGSPRRAAILRKAGIEPHVIAPALDDADAPSDQRDPCAHVMGLAWFKARVVLGQIARRAAEGAADDLPNWLVAADTMCFHDGRLIGKPRDEAALRSMIRSFQGRSHDVVTGICLVDRATGVRRLFFDSASVHLGEIAPEDLEAYVASGEWRGKAGGYNFGERLAAGWPLRCEGDPETVMGLPSRLVVPAIGAGPRAWRGGA